MPPQNSPASVKKVYLVGALLLICMGAGVLWVYPALKTSTQKPPVQSSLVAYRSDEHHIAFDYPDTYTLESHDFDITGVEGVYLVLMPKGVTLPEGGEGPPTVTVSIFKNPTHMPLGDWIQKQSGMIPASGGWDYTETKIGGEEAIAYTSTGLYESDNVAVAYGERVYVFSASWLTREDQTLKDLALILPTVTFTK